jgi:NAD-dependent DNA ligase
MNHYDPEQAINASEWLELDEGVRQLLVEEYHRDARIALPSKTRLLHASIHTVVENQLAMNIEPVVRALERLMKEGLSRHEAVHAIGSRVAEQIYDIMQRKETPEVLNARYYAAIEQLTAATWRNDED